MIVIQLGFFIVTFMAIHVTSYRSFKQLGLQRNINSRIFLIDGDDKPKLSMAEDNDKPRVLIQSLDDLNAKNKGKSNDIKGMDTKASYTTFKSSFQKDGTSSSSTDGSKPARESATFGSLSIDDLKGRMQKSDGAMKSWDDLPKRTEDLNGVNPITTILFSAFPAVVCYLLFTLSTYLSAHFAIDLVSSELYPVQRLAIVVRNLVVGLTTLGAGFCGIISVGLLALGITVAIGVAKGELDPNQDNPTGNVK